MKNTKRENSSDFSIIFNEIEKFNFENPTFVNNLLNEEELQRDESIRAFGEICQEIYSAGNQPTVYMTFS